ncbi:MAG: hypothetical protein ACT4OP_06095 [Actinomycetota bacterium]
MAKRLARLAGVASGLYGLWGVGVWITDALSPANEATAWSLAIGLPALAGSLLFLLDLERPRSMVRRWIGWGLMIVGAAIPTSISLTLLSMVLLGVFCLIPGANIGRGMVAAAGLTVLAVSALFVFGGGLLLSPVGAALLGVSVAKPRD